MKHEIICPYCNAVANYESSKKVYNGQDFGMMYICSNYPTCDAYVGVHKGSRTPLGRLADAELRKWKKMAHAMIDEYWKSGKMKRGSVYGAIQRIMGLSPDEAHIGKFDVAQCQELVEKFPENVRLSNDQ